MMLGGELLRTRALFANSLPLCNPWRLACLKSARAADLCIISNMPKPPPIASSHPTLCLTSLAQAPPTR